MFRGSKICALIFALPLLFSGYSFANPAADQAYTESTQLYSAGNYSAALAKAEEAARIDSQYWQAWQMAGNCRVALNDQKNAIIEYDYALAINPNNPGLKSYVDQLKASAQQAPAAAAPADHYALATQAYNAANYDLALKEGAEAVKINPQHWEAWQLIGSARYARGDKRGALEAYRKSLELNPANPQLKSFADSLDTELRNAPPVESSAVTPAASTGPGWQQSPTEKPAGGAGKVKPKVFALIGLVAGKSTINYSPFAKNIKDYIHKRLDVPGYTQTMSEKIPNTANLVGIDGVVYRGNFGIKMAINLGIVDDMTVSGKDVDGWGNTFDEEWVVNAGWIEGTVGLFGQMDLAKAAYARAGIHLGIGISEVDIKRSASFRIPSMFLSGSQSMEAKVSGLMIPVGVEAEGGINIMEKVELFAKTGWELRYSPLLTLENRYDRNGDGKVDENDGDSKYLVDVDGSPWPISQSGVYIQVGVRISRF